ncbi:MAG: DUF416 family protein [Candidatus Methylacidiphilales bacterium]|nr:DUF416 family protein [Candidatus Methylacidiphilales bacterium]
MTMLEYDESTLKVGLEKLSPERRMLFASLAATRVAPAYSIFHSQSGQGDESAYFEALQFLWSQLLIETVEEEKVEAYVQKVFSLIPAQGDTWVTWSAQAEDATTALVYALGCLKTASVREAAWAARRSYNTVDNIVVDDPSVQIGGAHEKQILSSPLIQAELQQQVHDLQMAETAELTDESLKQLYGGAIQWGTVFYAKVLQERQ